MEPNKLNDVLGLGAWLGRKQAFGLLAGKCSAADAECLKRMRDEKKYRSLGLNWADFCRTHVGVSRAAADKIIRLLEEFGPKYFELSAVVRITPEEYRRIAPSVTDGGVEHRGRLLPIAVDNASELSEAVEELRRESDSPAAPPQTALDRARKAHRAAVESFERAAALRPSGAARQNLLAELGSASAELSRVAEAALRG